MAIMTKLVLHFSVGDGYTYCCDENFPFLYESKEKAEYDLLTIWEDWTKRRIAANKNRKLPYVMSDIKFAGMELDMSNFSEWDNVKEEFRYTEPRILTLEEWFEEYSPKNYGNNTQ